MSARTAASPAGLMINRVHYPVTTLGHGTRAAIWTQGCSIGCRGCASQDTWDVDPDRAVDATEVLRWLDGLGPLDGVTLTGGEPFDQPAALAVLLAALAGWRKGQPRPVDLLVYSGYPHAVLRRRAGAAAAMAGADALITGPYVDRLNPGGRWRGSANQRVVPLSELGVARYGRYARQAEPDAEEEGVERRLQVASGGDRLWLVGIPRRGDLDRLDADLAARGIDSTGASWRT